MHPKASEGQETGKYDVDTTEATCISLCSGAAGLELGLAAGLGRSVRTLAYCERDAFACANLVAKMEAGCLDPAPVWTDLRTFPASEFHGLVDYLTAGYPCQPFSCAGKRAGADDERHLWPAVRRAIQLIRPGAVFLENVSGHVTLGLSTVLSDLEEDGYRCAWGLFSAAEVGAPHRRERVFILAHAHRAGQPAQLPREHGENSEQRAGAECAVGASGNHAGVCGALPGAVADGGETLADGGRAQRRPELRAGNGVGHRHDPRRQEAADRFGSCGQELAHAPRRGLGADGSAPGSAGYPDLGNAQPDNSQCAGLEGHAGNGDAAGRPEPAGPVAATGVCWPARPGERQHEWEPPRTVANTQNHHRRAGSAGEQAGAGQRRHGLADGSEEASSEVEPALGRDADGLSGGLDYAELCRASDNHNAELRLLGNAVCPAQAANAFRVLRDRLMVLA